MSFFYEYVLFTIYVFGALLLIITILFPKLKDSPTSNVIKFFLIVGLALSCLILFSSEQINIGINIVAVVSLLAYGIYIIYDEYKIKKAIRKYEETLNFINSKKTDESFNKYPTMKYTFFIKNNENYKLTKEKIVEEISKIENTSNLKEISSSKLANGNLTLERISFNHCWLEEYQTTKKIETIIKSNKNTVFVENSKIL